MFIAINIPCKFGEDIFINSQEVKVYVKKRQLDGRTHAQKAVYNLAFGRRHDIKKELKRIKWIDKCM